MGYSLSASPRRRDEIPTGVGTRRPRGRFPLGRGEQKVPSSAHRTPVSAGRDRGEQGVDDGMVGPGSMRRRSRGFGRPPVAPGEPSGRSGVSSAVPTPGRFGPSSRSASRSTLAPPPFGTPVRWSSDGTDSRVLHSPPTVFTPIERIRTLHSLIVFTNCVHYMYGVVVPINDIHESRHASSASGCIHQFQQLRGAIESARTVHERTGRVNHVIPHGVRHYPHRPAGRGPGTSSTETTRPITWR